MIEPYYKKDGIAIYHGDCREILPQLSKVDLVLTDPPYGVVNRGSQGLRRLDKGDADEVFFEVEDIASKIDGCVQGSLYVWCSTEQVSYWRAAFVDLGMTTRLCIWEKSNPSPLNGQYIWLSSVECCVFARKSKAVFNQFCKSPVWRGSVARSVEHLTTKPLWLMEEAILASSNPGNMVLDPFMGSGTTLVAARALGRKGIGIEIQEKYCEVAVRRLEAAVKDSDG